MKKILLIVCLICSCRLFATTIIIYITPDFVIMATDSKAVYTNAKTYTQTSAVVSKIYKSGNVYFSLAGLIANDTRSFNVASLINSKLRGTGSLSNAIAQIKMAVKAGLLMYLSNQKKDNPSLYKTNLAAEKYITSIGIVTIKNNRPYTHLIGFVASDNNGLNIKTEEEVYAPGSTKDAVYYLGTSGEINKYMNTIQRINAEPVQFVKKLMDLQIVSTPQLVAPPIDILKLTPKQTTWISRKKGTPVELE